MRKPFICLPRKNPSLYYIYRKHQKDREVVAYSCIFCPLDKPDQDFLELAELFLQNIDFYFKSNSTSDIKIASYKISEKKTLFFKSSSLQFEPCIILNYLKEFKIAHEQNIYDIFNGHKLKIVHSELHSKISIDENCITTVFGCIDRGFFLAKK